MACRKNLLTVDFHYDDETGMHEVGEIDFGVNGLLKEYIEKYGHDGVKNILSTLGHLAWEVKQEFYEIQQNKQKKNMNEACNQ